MLRLRGVLDGLILSTKIVINLGKLRKRIVFKPFSSVPPSQKISGELKKQFCELLLEQEASRSKRWYLDGKENFRRAAIIQQQ